MSLVPVQAHGERGQPRAVTCGSSRESDLHPESSFTGKYGVGQRGERGGVRCSLIHPREKQESGVLEGEGWKPRLQNTRRPPRWEPNRWPTRPVSAWPLQSPVRGRSSDLDNAFEGPAAAVLAPRSLPCILHSWSSFSSFAILFHVVRRALLL